MPKGSLHSYIIWVSDWQSGREESPKDGPPQLLTATASPFVLRHQTHLCPGTHLGIVDVVGATVLSKLAEGLKPGGVREVGAHSTWEGAGVQKVNTQGHLPPEGGGRLGSGEWRICAQGQRPALPFPVSKEHRSAPGGGPSPSGTKPWFSYWSSWTRVGFRQPWVALSRQVVSAFQVGVSSAKKCSYSAGERGLPGVEVGTESSLGAAGGKSSTAGRGTDGWVDGPNSRTRSWPGMDPRRPAEPRVN